MTHKWVCPEVPRIGALKGNHTELVRRVSSISKELDCNAWVSRVADIVSYDISLGDSDENMLSAFEDSCVGIAL